MALTNKSIDLYITKSPAFAQPILNHLRALIHKACPQVEEKIKWSFPHFDYKGEMMCSMAAFKQHAVMGFWKASLMKDPILLETAKSEIAMGHLGKITTLKDLPPDKKIIAWIKEAMELNDEGVRLPAKKKLPLKELEVPAFFMKALKANKKAFETFRAFSYSDKKEYVDWIVGNKTEAVRTKNLATAIQWMKEGKTRLWKYKQK